MNSYKNKTVLLVEDNEGDIVITTELFEEIDPSIIIEIARDGIEAIDFIKNNIEQKTALPNLILLDINLPKKNGFEVLDFIKHNVFTQNIPVIMTSTSSSENDIKISLNKQASDFVTKSSDFKDFENYIINIYTRWL